MKKTGALFFFLCLCFMLTACNGGTSSADPLPTPLPANPQGFEREHTPSVPPESEVPATPDAIPDATPDATSDATSEPTPFPTPGNLVAYTGELQHVFFHYLIAYPDIAYGTTYGRNLDTDCVTPTEFRRALEQLYENNYVLVDLNSYITVHDDGSVTKNPIYVPEGKKPLVMSFDDINYYQTKLGLGTCDKVILDEEGELAMLTVLEDGTELVTYDNCVIPALESFCREFPDFAPFGVKGMLALTGYDGLLGYRVQRDSPNRESEIEALKPVIQALKDRGWYFASHSYGHIHSDAVGVDKVIDDTDKWLNEAASLLGPTQIYVFPFGETDSSGTRWDDHDTAKYRALIDRGFRILCGVGMPPYFRMYENHAFMDRQNIDGYTLRNQRKWFEGLIDPETVYCQEERGGIPITGE